MGDVIGARDKSLLARRRPVRIDHDHDIDLPEPLLDRHDRKVDLIRQQIAQCIVLIGKIKDPQETHRLSHRLCRRRRAFSSMIGLHCHILSTMSASWSLRTTLPLSTGYT